LNNLYSVPRKTAPDWVKGDKLLLLLDGLDEVRQESRAKCVEAINAFRKEHGLTSLAVCSRSQDYADLNAKLSFEGAIEVQPLTQEQIHVFFNHFGDEMAGIKQALEKDSALREMTETPLFLSIMIMAYRNKQDIEILASKDQNAQRKHLFGSYIERMFERTHLKNMPFQKQNILCWLSWLASKMIENNATPYLFEDMQPKWVNHKERTAYEWIALYRLIVGLSVSLFGGLFIGLIAGLSFGLIQGTMTGLAMGLAAALDYGLKFSLIFGLITGVGIILGGKLSQIKMTDSLVWDWKRGKTGLIIGSIGGLAGGMVIGSVVAWIFWQLIKQYPELATDTISIGSLSKNVIFVGIIFGLLGGLSGLAVGGIGTKQIDHTMFPGERISSSTKNFFYAFLLAGLSIWLIFGLIGGLSLGEGPMGMIIIGAYIAPSAGLLVGLILGGLAVVQHYTLRVILTLKKFLPFRIPLFLDHCVDLIFLRRVGGGYIFVHRLLMEHFAEMYVETPTSKGNQK
jgi:MFS family permease